MASFITNIFLNKKINDSNHKTIKTIKIEVKEKTCSNENIFESKLKIISNEDKYLQFLFIKNKFKDIDLYKKEIKYNCENGKFENLLLYDLEYVDTEFLRELFFLMKNKLELIRNQNLIRVKDTKEGLIKCINFIQMHLDFDYRY